LELNRSATHLKQILHLVRSAIGARFRRIVHQVHPALVAGSAPTLGLSYKTGQKPINSVSVRSGGIRPAGLCVHRLKMSHNIHHVTAGILDKKTPHAPRLYHLLGFRFDR
jgi:hypothetical protein